jgi:hypothetical protein
MEINVLGRCTHAIGYWIHEDESVIDELLNPETDWDEKFIDPFKKELNLNLLEKETHDAKRDILKYYIYEFWDIQSFFKSHSWLLDGITSGFKDEWSYTDTRDGVKKKADEWECYVLSCSELFNILMDEIQVCCMKFNIDFFPLCDELFFRIDTFDSGTSVFFEDYKNGGFKNDHSESIYGDLLSGSDNEEGIALGFSINSKEKESIESNNDLKRTNDFMDKNDYSRFDNIFVAKDWHQYINVFTKTSPPLLNKEWQFIGKLKKHKGVLCSWIKHLQNKGIIKMTVNRAQLSKVLNNEIKFLNLGVDGKTIDNYSNVYVNKFEQQLIELTKID